MDTQIAILLLILISVLCGAYTGAVAKSKGHPADLWFTGGFLFGPLALLASMGLADLKLQKYIRLLAEHQGALPAKEEAKKVVSQDFYK